MFSMRVGIICCDNAQIIEDWLACCGLMHHCFKINLQILNIFLQSRKVMTHWTSFDCVLNTRYVLPVAMHFVRALTKALNSVLYWISGTQTSISEDVSFNRSMVYMNRRQMVHLCCQRSKWVKFTASCWDHRSKCRQVCSSSAGEAITDGCSVAAIWMLLDIRWEHSPCHHWPGTTPACLKRSIDHASTRCSNADAEVPSHPRQNSRQGLMDGSDRLQRSFSFHSSPRGNSNFRGSLVLDDCLSLTLTRAPVIAELPTHLLLAVAAKPSKDLWQSNEADVHLWSCRSLWKFFDFKLLAQSQSNWFHKSFWLGKQKLPQKFLNSKSQT